MKKILRVALPLSAAVFMVGCAPLPPAVAPAALVPCATCAPEAVYGIAVTRPSPCNDFPVTYRVQMPETDKRVRFVDRPELVSSSTRVSSVASCGR